MGNSQFPKSATGLFVSLDEATLAAAPKPLIDCQLKGGFLQKRGTVLTEYRKRYCVLSESGQLKYYRQDTRSGKFQFRGVVHMSICTAVHLFADKSISTALCGFVVKTPVKNWYFRAKTEAVARQWIDCIEHCRTLSAATVRRLTVEWRRQERDDDLDAPSFPMAQEPFAIGSGETEFKSDSCITDDIGTVKQSTALMPNPSVDDFEMLEQSSDSESALGSDSNNEDIGNDVDIESGVISAAGECHSSEVVTGKRKQTGRRLAHGRLRSGALSLGRLQSIVDKTDCSFRVHCGTVDEVVGNFKRLHSEFHFNLISILDQNLCDDESDSDSFSSSDSHTDDVAPVRVKDDEKWTTVSSSDSDLVGGSGISKEMDEHCAVDSRTIYRLCFELTIACLRHVRSLRCTKDKRKRLYRPLVPATVDEVYLNFDTLATVKKQLESLWLKASTEIPVKIVTEAIDQSTASLSRTQRTRIEQAFDNPRVHECVLRFVNECVSAIYRVYQCRFGAPLAAAFPLTDSSSAVDDATDSKVVVKGDESLKDVEYKLQLWPTQFDSASTLTYDSSLHSKSVECRTLCVSLPKTESGEPLVDFHVFPGIRSVVVSKKLRAAVGSSCPQSSSMIAKPIVFCKH